MISCVSSKLYYGIVSLLIGFHEVKVMCKAHSHGCVKTYVSGTQWNLFLQIPEGSLQGAKNVDFLKIEKLKNLTMCCSVHFVCLSQTIPRDCKPIDGLSRSESGVQETHPCGRENHIFSPPTRAFSFRSPSGSEKYGLLKN